jgi:hypothetical protein
MRTSTASLARKSKKKDMPSKEVKDYNIRCYSLGTRHKAAFQECIMTRSDVILEALNC